MNSDIEALANAVEPFVLAAAREWHAPPGEPKTANNWEVLYMNIGRFALAVSTALGTTTINGETPAPEQINEVLPLLIARHPRIAEISGCLQNEGVVGFCSSWCECSFARVEISHKLCAAFALTDIDTSNFRAPWHTWSIVVPDGLLPGISRIWCKGASPVAGIYTNTPKALPFQDPTIKNTPTAKVANNLVASICLALTNPDDFKKAHSSKRTKGNNRIGPPILGQARFMLSAPVKIDLRGRLHDVLSGKVGSSPKVQFLVRGHWREQAHGPSRSLRKHMWIEPFWKGPEESRVLLRNYQL